VKSSIVGKPSLTFVRATTMLILQHEFSHSSNLPAHDSVLN
jgi:hypothetical protein